MEHSDYTKLTSLFDYINTGIQLLHWAQNEGKRYMADPTSTGLLRWPGIQSGVWYIFARDNSHDTDKLNDLLSGGYHAIWVFMSDHEDGFYYNNQQRADNKCGPTNDLISLVRSMTRFVSGYENNNSLGDIVRDMSKRWIDQANAWFPNLNDQAGHQIPANPNKKGRFATVSIDLERFKGCFNKEFNTPPKPGGPEQLSRCMKLYFAMSGQQQFTKTDWGRVAYAIKYNSKIRADHVVWMDFTPWLKEFFNIIGLEPPKDTRQNKYQDEAGTKSFITVWMR